MDKKAKQIQVRQNGENPLVFAFPVTTPTEVAHKKCLPLNCKHGKKVPLYRIMNYNDFHECIVCHVSIREGVC